jgi:hypothetical protein
MTDSHTTPEAAILVAVDIAKDHNEVLIELRERRNHRRRFRVANTLGGVPAAGRIPAPARCASADRFRSNRQLSFARWRIFFTLRVSSCG